MQCVYAMHPSEYGDYFTLDVLMLKIIQVDFVGSKQQF